MSRPTSSRCCSGVQPLTTPGIRKPRLSTLEDSKASIKCGAKESGRSDHHGLNGGGGAVPKERQMLRTCSHVKSSPRKYRFQSRRRRARSSAGSPPRLMAPLNAKPGGICSRLNPKISASESTFCGWFSASARSAAHQSRLYGEGTRFLLFSRNSPKPTRNSPLSHSETTRSLTSRHSVAVSMRLKVPSSSRTDGPSISTEGVTAAAFPGLSVFI